MDILQEERLLRHIGTVQEDIPFTPGLSGDKKCSITFDCAWGADDIPEILDILDRYNAKALFIVGLWAEKFPDMVKTDF